MHDATGRYTAPFDELDRCGDYEPPNGPIAYAYDAAGRLRRTFDAAVGRMTFAWDAAGTGAFRRLNGLSPFCGNG